MQSNNSSLIKFALTGIAAISIAVIVLVIAKRSDLLIQAFAAVVINFANAYVGLLYSKKGLKGTQNDFLKIVFGGMAVRLLAVLAIFTLCLFVLGFDRLYFTSIFFVSYFLFLAVELYLLLLPTKKYNKV